MRSELLKGLTAEQIEKANACRTPEELLQLASDEGVELTAEQLAAVSGGGCGSDNKDDNKDSDNDGKHRKIES